MQRGRTKCESYRLLPITLLLIIEECHKLGYSYILSQRHDQLERFESMVAHWIAHFRTHLTNVYANAKRACSAINIKLEACVLFVSRVVSL